MCSCTCFIAKKANHLFDSNVKIFILVEFFRKLLILKSKDETLLSFLAVVYHTRIVTLQSVCRFYECIAFFSTFSSYNCRFIYEENVKIKRKRKKKKERSKIKREKSEISSKVGNNNILVFDSWCVRRESKTVINCVRVLFW